jgi:glycosyltransferase involved in cell wall biosynthesis
MKRIKIAYLIDTIATGTAGTQKQLLEIIRRLDPAEFEPQLICLWQSPWMTANPLPCPCTVLGYRGFLKPNFPSVVRKLAAKIDADGIDVIQTFFEDSIFVAASGAALARSSPVLLSSRRDIGLGESNQPWYHRLFGLALPAVNRRFQGIIANSEQVRRYVAQREKTPATKIEVIYNGVTISARAGTVPAVFQKAAADVWLGLVASLTSVKRHDLLIRALATVAKTGNGPRVHLVLLGDGPERDRLEMLAAQCGIADLVHFEGAVTDVSAYLQELDIGVLCSDREGLSNAILEYMAAGLPVVATEVGGNAELVTHENGICVPANDVDALSGALGLLIADAQMRTSMGAASFARVQRDFSWENSMARLQAYYRARLAAHEAS